MKLDCFAALLLFATCGCASEPKGAQTAPSPPLALPTATSRPSQNEAPNDSPAYHAQRLEDPATREASAQRILQMFDYAMMHDHKDPNGPTVRPLVEAVVEPMTEACVAGRLNDETHRQTLKLLVDARDPRASACLVKTLQKVEVDGAEKEVGLAARGLAAMRVKEAAGPLFDAFRKLRASKPNASLVYRDMSEAVVSFSDPTWAPSCISMIEKPMQDRKDIATLKDEMFWQITCAQVLGKIRSEAAVPSLIKIVLSPMKADVQATAINALIRIGKAAVPPAVALLKGEKTDWSDYAKSEALRAGNDGDGSAPPGGPNEAEAAYLAPAAILLGSIGRQEAREPMLEVSKKARPEGKVVLARELLKLPLSAESLKKVQEVYVKTDLTLTIPPGMNARGALAEQMGYTFDSSLVPWIVKDSVGLKGDAEDLEEVRGNAFVLALKLARPNQTAELEKIGKLPASGGSTIGKGYEKEWRLAKALLNECSETIDCYLGKLSDPRAHTGDQMFMGIKAAYMVGVLGNREIVPRLLRLLPKTEGLAARFVLTEAMDHFLPEGDKATGEALLGMFAEAEAAKDARKMAEYSFFKQFGTRWIARAEP